MVVITLLQKRVQEKCTPKNPRLGLLILHTTAAMAQPRQQEPSNPRKMGFALL